MPWSTAGVRGAPATCVGRDAINRNRPDEPTEAPWEQRGTLRRNPTSRERRRGGVPAAQRSNTGSPRAVPEAADLTITEWQGNRSRRRCRTSEAIVRRGRFRGDAYMPYVAIGIAHQLGVLMTKAVADACARAGTAGWRRDSRRGGRPGGRKAATEHAQKHCRRSTQSPPRPASGARSANGRTAGVGLTRA